MDVLPLIFLIGLALVGGGIAVAADMLGKKLGKKRLSFMGLRPRHTAMLGTFVLGLFISLFTIVLVAGLSRDVRQWILQGRNAIAQRDQAIQQRNEEQRNLGVVELRSKAFEARIPVLQHEIQLDQQKIGQGAGLISSQQQQIGEQKAHLVNLVAEQRDLQAKLFDTNRRIRLDDKQIKLDEQSLARNQKLLASNTRQLKSTVTNLNRSMMEGYKLDQQNAKLSQQNEGLQQDISRLQTDRETLENQRTTLSSEVTDIASRLNQEEDALGRARQEVDRLQNQISISRRFIDSTFLPSRIQPLIYGLGQEVTRLPVRDHLTRVQAQDDLESLLRMARDEAEAHGAKAHPGYDVAEVMPHTPDDSTQPVSPEEYKGHIVDQLVDKPDDQVLIATSTLNAFKGEVVSLEIEVKSNKMAFHRGEIVASSNIDGSRSETEISNDIAQLLSVRVRDEAKKRNMIPMPNGEFGFDSLPEDELFRTIQTIKSVGRYCRVQAVALDDTRVADVLKLDLHIR